MPKNIVRLVVSILICEGAGWLGSFFTGSSIPNWYATLARPAFNPPNWIFAPVWTVLFLLMGVSLFLVWQKAVSGAPVKAAMIIFFIQLALNILWSVLFFGLHNPLLAFVEIIFLWLAILASIIYFYKISLSAAWLLLPYILWVSFAAVLNFFIWRLNA